jgi:glycosyltransferase involved in cell wall biosynthesis
MKIVHVVPGSGGSFYCENCMRDTALVKALQRTGHDVRMVPMYLPLFGDHTDGRDAPVFFGAVNLYLKEKLPAYRRAPRWLQRLLDSGPVLKWAARHAGSTRATGLEDLTLSMLRGESGRQAAELAQLVDWLKDEVAPDVVHLSNALLVGLARQIKSRLHVPVVCSLQDEDTWLDSMDERYRAMTWNTLIERSGDVDAFIGVSGFYGETMRSRMRFPTEKLHTIHIGIDLSGHGTAALDLDPPTIGYLSRTCEALGLGTLVEAFMLLKRRPRLEGLRLKITGGATGDDAAFVEGLKQRLAAAGLLDDVDFVPGFERAERLRFLESLSLMSVPVPDGEAFGVYQIEAMASGVPVVQPGVGAFPEIVGATGGGVIYEPHTAEGLAAAVESLLNTPERLRELGAKGRETVHRDFGVDRMAERLTTIYERVCTTREQP